MTESKWKTKPILGWVINAVISISLLCYFTKTIPDYYKKVTFQAKQYNLKRSLPTEYGYLIYGVRQNVNEVENKKQINRYIDYYHRVLKVFPEAADVMGMLAYCYYYTGDTETASDWYLRASEINPNYFWNHYNMGLIYFEKEKYKEAVEALSKAIKSDYNRSLKFIEHSVLIYGSILKSDESFYKATAPRLMKGYRDAFVLLSLSYYRLGKHDTMLNIARGALKYNFSEKNIFYFYAGIALFQTGSYEQSGLFFKESLKSYPKVLQQLEAKRYRSLKHFVEELGRVSQVILEKKESITLQMF